MKVVFGKTNIEKMHDRVMSIVAKKATGYFPSVEYVILSSEEFQDCVSKQTSVYTAPMTKDQVLKFKGIYYVKEISLDLAYDNMYEILVEEAKEYLSK